MAAVSPRWARRTSSSTSPGVAERTKGSRNHPATGALLLTMNEITVVGGGLGGLVAAISCAEGGARVRLLEAHRQLGGRARTSEGAFRANLGPHVIYDDGPLWTWLVERGLAGDEPRSPVRGIRFRRDG